MDDLDEHKEVEYCDAVEHLAKYMKVCEIDIFQASSVLQAIYGDEFPKEYNYQALSVILFDKKEE